MHEQQKHEKVYNTCDEKATSYHNECVNSKKHGCYHGKVHESQQTNETI